jgi:3-oxoacyl-[acyl-carrier protein] reductase
MQPDKHQTTTGCALVTGASRGIGAASACELAAAGHRVVVNYRRDRAGAEAVVARIIERGGTALGVQADVSRAADVEALFATAERELGRVLVLVNNAGMIADDLVVDTPDAAWDEIHATNLTGVFQTVRRAVPGMLRARHGRIVNVSSVSGIRGNPGQAGYAATKAGVLGLTRAVAVEVGRRGITVNAVAPGLIDTAMSEHVGQEMVAMVPARRTGTPAEVAAAICFLASPQASYVNGATLVVDGGLTA